MKRPLGILIVDDTIVYRSILKQALSEMKGVEVVGTASNGRLALDKIPLVNPDIVLLDLEMPEMDGLQALAEIRSHYPRINVVMVSGTTRSSADSTIKALELGALDFVHKPEGRDAQKNIDKLRQLLRPIMAALASSNQPAARTFNDSRRMRRTVDLSLGAKIALPRDPCRLVVIGCSTGGPTALMKVVSHFPADFPAPIMVVQHMPAGFTASLAQSLDSRCALKVREAAHAEQVKTGRIYVAPGGRHMQIGRYDTSSGMAYTIRLSDSPAVNNCRPSVDALLESVLAKFEQPVLTVVLTGMGSDGLDGVRSLKKHNRAFCITQSEATCVVYGMPRAVERAGLSDLILPLDTVGDAVNRVVGLGAHVSRNH